MCKVNSDQFDKINANVLYLNFSSSVFFELKKAFESVLTNRMFSALRFWFKIDVNVSQ